MLMLLRHHSFIFIDLLELRPNLGHARFDHADCSPIKLTPKGEAEHTLLRGLSQMSRRLRHFALPLLCSAVRISTVYRLGKLRDVLREWPHLAQHVRQFTFSWKMGGDASLCKSYSRHPAGHGIHRTSSLVESSQGDSRR